MKKSIMVILISIILSLTACTNVPAEEIENDIPVETVTENQSKPTYEASDNSIDALISRANITPSGYLISHYGNSQCHVLLGVKTSEIPVTINDEQLTLERLINCEIDSNNTCLECGKSYSAEEFEFPNKAELIQQYIEANAPVIEEPQFGLVKGFAPYGIENVYLYEFDLNIVDIQDNIISTPNYNLEISVITDSINGKLDQYLPNESNLGELKSNDSYKYVSQFSDEEQTQLLSIYIIKDLEKGCIIHKFSDINNMSEESILEEVINYDNAYDETSISIKDFYKSIAEKNTDIILLEDVYKSIVLSSNFIPDYNKQLVNTDCISAYIDTTEDSNISIIISNYTMADLEQSEFNIIEVSESDYTIYERDGYYYFKSDIENIDSTVNTLFGFSGFNSTEEALAFYISIVQ